jgi:hypothetical protein
VQRKLSACASFYRYAEFVGDLVEKVRVFVLPRGERGQAQLARKLRAAPTPGARRAES